MNLSYAFVSINILALAMIVLTLIAIYGKKDKRGGKELGLVIVFIFIGSLCIFLENVSQTYEAKLLFRNLSQIGLFLLPSSSYNFIMVYTREENKIFNKMRYINFIFAIICVILIFTNNHHHIMRVSVELKELSSILVLKVNQTLFGKIAVTLNTLMNLIAMIKLWVFMRTTSKNTRKQVMLLLIGFLIPIIYTYSKSALFNIIGVEIPTPLSFLIGIIIMLIGMYRYDFMSISPIAREWVIDEINVGMIFTNESGEIVDINNFIKTNFSVDTNELSTKIKSCDEWYKAITENNDTELEYVNDDENTSVFLIKVHSLSKNKKHIGTISLLTDITIEKQYQNELIELAEKDSMTQLLNRSTFESKVNSLLVSNTASDELCALIIIDIDHFKQINDQYGHQTGDKVIKDIVNIIRNHFRTDDLVGRLGGDEFMVFISNCSKKQINKIINRIQNSIKNYPFESEGIMFSVTLSIGISIPHSDSAKFSDIYKEADTALYEVKENGRNDYKYFE